MSDIQIGSKVRMKKLVGRKPDHPPLVISKIETGTTPTHEGRKLYFVEENEEFLHPHVFYEHELILCDPLTPAFL